MPVSAEHLSSLYSSLGSVPVQQPGYHLCDKNKGCLLRSLARERAIQIANSVVGPTVHVYWMCPACVCIWLFLLGSY